MRNSYFHAMRVAGIPTSSPTPNLFYTHTYTPRPQDFEVISDEEVAHNLEQKRRHSVDWTLLDRRSSLRAA